MNEAEGISLTERQRYWLEQIQACEASGKTIAEYAMDQGIGAKAMYAGKKALVMKGVLRLMKDYITTLPQNSDKHVTHT